MRGWLSVVGVLAGAALAVAAPQAPVPSPAEAVETVDPVDPVDPDPDPDPDSADLSITATVRYRELKFEQVGTPKVEFKGGVDAPALGTKTDLKTVWHTDRGTLPRPVQPGALYRDGAVKLTITSRFEDLARLFAEDASSAPAPSPSPQP